MFILHYQGLRYPICCWWWRCQFALVDSIIWLPLLHGLFLIILALFHAGVHCLSYYYYDYYYYSVIRHFFVVFPAGTQFLYTDRNTGDVLKYDMSTLSSSVLVERAVLVSCTGCVTVKWTNCIRGH